MTELGLFRTELPELATLKHLATAVSSNYVLAHQFARVPG